MHSNASYSIRSTFGCSFVVGIGEAQKSVYDEYLRKTTPFSDFKTMDFQFIQDTFVIIYLA